MPDMRVFLGLDTSNYTTSAALVGEDGELIANLKRPLPVKGGAVGLRQSDAVFAHVKNLPSLTEELGRCMEGCELIAIGVSTRPRNVEGSYMPCFLVGQGVADSIAAVRRVPVFSFSHQCGHMMAAIASSRAFSLMEKSFAAFHVSGGTTDVLRVCASGDGGFLAECVGGAVDLHAGQVIDRVGVYMGVPFPCGMHMERLALDFHGKIPKKKISVSGLRANLSGLENLAKRMYDETADASLVSAFVFRYIAETLAALSDAYTDAYGASSFLYAGGVMSNTLIKAYLADRFPAHFAEPALSSDNAVGIAHLARRAYLAGERK